MNFINGLPAQPKTLCGVYCLIFDGGRFYVGCSKNLRKRYNEWASDFRTRNGDNNKVMSEALTAPFARMEVIELCSEDDLMQRETFYLDKYSSSPLLLSYSRCAWRPVLQYTIDGEFIKRHVSIKDAARFNSIKLSKVQMVLNGLRRSHKGLVFMYENKEPLIKDEKQLPKKTKALRVCQLDECGNEIAVYATYEIAAKAVGCSRRNIQRVILGEQKTAAGFVWGLR